MARSITISFASEVALSDTKDLQTAPGVKAEAVESYADLQTDEWTKLKIDVHGREAKLYVNGSDKTEPHRGWIEG